jgi:cystathionine gamma-synthase
MPVVRDQGALMIVDDTLATPFNVTAMRHADIVVTSLTKFFCGHGDVFAGAMLLNPASPHYDRLSAASHANHEDLLWGPDAVVLEERSRDFESRVRRINQVAEDLADYLRDHTAMETLYYPKFDQVGGYEALRAEQGGLISILLHDAPRNAPQFYDRLMVSKGPSLGTNYTLVCPYTLLAHYRELDWAESHGVSRWLLRISVGMEDSGDLRARFADALDSLS